jgi:hypothetical protein
MLDAAMLMNRNKTNGPNTGRLLIASTLHVPNKLFPNYLLNNKNKLNPKEHKKVTNNIIFELILPGDSNPAFTLITKNKMKNKLQMTSAVLNITDIKALVLQNGSLDSKKESLIK